MKNTYIKSPLNYVGGKYKLLPQIIPLIPKDINTFVDLFGGGFNVGINIEAKHLVYNDICKQVVDLLEHFYNNDSEYIHNMILKTISDGLILMVMKHMDVSQVKVLANIINLNTLN